MSNNPTLLSLPYDIRYLIYQHLFPPGPHVYIQALPHDTLHSITAEHSIPTALLSTCHQIYSEASEFLYNNYLFNIVGRKTEVLGLYQGFKTVLERWAREEVYVCAFSNGRHSATMCVSLYSGEGKGGILKRRERGVAVGMGELEREVGGRGGYRGAPRFWGDWGLLGLAVLSGLVVVLAWWLVTRVM